MKLSEFKAKLHHINTLNFVLPDGQYVPRHFHITEVGLATKHYMDCGGTIRTKTTAVLQIWVANDYEHRLSPSGLLKIFDLSHKILGQTDPELVVEYQTNTVGIYRIGFESEIFKLLPTHTDCLAKQTCGIFNPLMDTQPQANKQSGCCSPGGGCC